MTKKIFLLLSLLSFSIFAAGTVIDTVVVPVKILRQSAGGFYGKVNYDLHVGDYDSLNISLQINPVTTGAAVIIDSTKGSAGTFSTVSGMNGTNEIWFWAHGGTAGASYTAQVSITANYSGVETQTNALIDQMTNPQKDDQLHAVSATNPRVGADVTVNGTLLPGWYASNGGSGVGRGASGTATTFPSPCAMGCTFDTALNYAVGLAIAKEYWAKNKYVIEGPVVNMTRDPRGGRSFENFGEDPYLTAKCAVAWTKGAQSTKATVIPMNFVCNDFEPGEGSVDVNPISERTLREIYCMPFEYCVKEGKAWGVMTAFNMVNGKDCTENSHLMTDILKNDWGFRGYTFSDWQAISSCAPAANAGQDVELPQATFFGSILLNSIGTGANQVTQARFDDMARRMVRTKVWGGVVGGNTTRYTADLKSQGSRDVCLAAARKSIVLVKNTNNTLPLAKTAKVAVVGNYTHFRATGAGSGEMMPFVDETTVSPLQGITAKVGAANVVVATAADVVIACYGVTGETEGANRPTLSLDNPDTTLLTAAHAAGKKTVVVLTGGSAAIDGQWRTEADAIIVAWYPGELQGTALADILFGDVNPSGKLASQWPVAKADIPPFNNSRVFDAYEGTDTGRGYRYSDKCGKTPLFAFGFGMSYTTFAYSNIRIGPSPAFVGDIITVTVNVKNTGTVAGDEIAELYVHENNSPVPRTVKDLRGFARTGILQPGASTDVTFVLHERELAYWDVNANKFVAPADHYTIMVGSSSRAMDLTLQCDLNLRSPN